MRVVPAAGEPFPAQHPSNTRRISKVVRSTTQDTIYSSLTTENGTTVVRASQEEKEAPVAALRMKDSHPFTFP